MIYGTPCPFAVELERLLEEAWYLQLKFHEYETLFADVSVLNSVAPRFFQVIYHAMWGDMVLHLARLTGPAQTRLPHREPIHNLSVQRLKALVPPDIKAKVAIKVDAAVLAAEFVKDPRNKVYAHADLNASLSADASGIKLGSRAMMDGAIKAVVDALMTVHDSIAVLPLTYRIPDNAGGADDLVAALRRSLGQVES